MLFHPHVRLLRQVRPWGQSTKACLHLQEYEAKELLKRAYVNVQPFVVVDGSMDKIAINDAVKALAAAYPHDALVVKAQVLAGGRGKGHFPESGLQGGVKVTASVDEAVKLLFDGMLNRRLVTLQSPPEGLLVEKVFSHFHFKVLDRRTRSPMLICSPMGGIDIEKVALEKPEAILSIPIDDDANASLPLERICRHLGLPEDDPEIHHQIFSLVRLFFSSDALQVEINPLAMLPNGEDAKIEIDDAALFRQRRFSTPSALDEREAEASRHSLSFVRLNGTIGSLVNGAGLAMATMDLIKEFDGSAANFLDVGGSASVSQIAGGLQIIASDPNVRAIFINIFGGIMRCDVVASGLISACHLLEQQGITLPPIVVRLAGTKLQEAIALIKDSGLPFLVTADLSEGARLAVAAAATKHRALA